MTPRFRKNGNVAVLHYHCDTKDLLLPRTTLYNHFFCATHFTNFTMGEMFMCGGRWGGHSGGQSRGHSRGQSGGHSGGQSYVVLWGGRNCPECTPHNSEGYTPYNSNVAFSRKNCMYWLRCKCASLLKKDCMQKKQTTTT